MADAGVTPGRHRRQRSSVTIKKRVSHTPLQDKVSDSYEVPDNALSPRAQTTTNQALAGETLENATAERPVNPENSLLFQSTEVQASNLQGLSASRAGMEQGRQNVASTDANADAAQAAGSTDPHNFDNHNRNAPGHTKGYQFQDATTRVEPDLFGDEDSASDLSTISTGMTSSTPSNPVLPTEQGIAHVASPSSATTPKTSSLGFADTASTPGARSGIAHGRAPLLINTSRSNGETSSSPRTSPRALRMQPSSSQTASGTPRSARKIKRMSLGYFANADTAIDSPITSASGFPMTPPTTAGSSSVPSTRTAMHSAPRSASVSTTASVESAVKSSTLLEGETLLTQDKDTLARIAEKERAILELRETLVKEERELVVLKREWQRSAQRKIAHNAPLNLEKGSMASSMAASSQDKDEIASIASAQTPSTGTTDALRGISARLQSNFGTQINAFLDHLVPISPHLDQDKALPEDAATERSTSSQPLSVLPEEEEHDAKRREAPGFQTTSNVVQGSQLGQKQIENSASQQTKRGSMLATSFAAFQKQMEKQLNTSLGGGEAHYQSEAGNETGWSSWQKRLKDARDNASDFLAKAEARIGQVMTLDDLIKLEGPEQEGGKATMSRSDSVNAFEEENDREKAALAELSWMNSLAGLKTSGTVDRVITSAASPRIGESSNLLTERSTLNESSKPLETTNVHSAVRPTGSIPVVPTRENGKSRRSSESTNEAAKGGSGGFFNTLSTVWATAIDISPPTSSKPLSPVTNRDRRLSGQNKSRSAAQAAVRSRPEKNADGVPLDMPSASASTKTVQKKPQAPSPETQAKADNDWSW